MEIRFGMQLLYKILNFIFNSVLARSLAFASERASCLFYSYFNNKNKKRAGEAKARGVFATPNNY